MRRSALFSTISSAAGILLLAAGCAESTPLMVEVKHSSALEAVAPVAARPVAVAYTAGTFSEVIGPNGGVVEFGIGQLHFPAGALEQPTRISATTTGSGMIVDFEPHGIQFPANAEPVLTFYSERLVLGNGDFEIQYVDDKFQVLERLTTLVDLNKNSASAKLAHFSPYILAQN